MTEHHQPGHEQLPNDTGGAGGSSRGDNDRDGSGSDRSLSLSIASSLPASPRAFATTFEGLADDVLLCVAAFLPRSSFPAFFLACRTTAALASREVLWEGSWPWPSDKGTGYLPTHASSWREAHRQCRTLYQRGDLVAHDGEEADLPGDITCAVLSNRSRYFGDSSGVVTVLTAGDPRPARFVVGGGSVRHMQLSGAGSLLFVGSWAGTVHCIHLASGRVWEVVGGLGGPVYGLRVSGSTLIACSGGTLSTWRLMRVPVEGARRGVGAALSAVYRDGAVDPSLAGAVPAARDVVDFSIRAPDAATPPASAAASCVEAATELDPTAAAAGGSDDDEDHVGEAGDPQYIIVARQVGVLEGHTGAVTDLVIQKLRQRKRGRAYHYSGGAGGLWSTVNDDRLKGAGEGAPPSVSSPVCATPSWAATPLPSSNGGTSSGRGGYASSASCFSSSSSSRHAVAVPAQIGHTPALALGVPSLPGGGSRAAQQQAQQQAQPGRQISHRLAPQGDSSVDSSGRGTGDAAAAATSSAIFTALGWGGGGSSVSSAASSPASPSSLPAAAAASVSAPRLSISSFGAGRDLDGLSYCYSGGGGGVYSSSGASGGGVGGLGRLASINRIVSSSYDGTLRVWNVGDGACVGVLRGHRGPVWTVQVVGNCIFSGSADGTVRVWRPLHQLVAAQSACAQPPLRTCGAAVTSAAAAANNSVSSSSVERVGAPSVISTSIIIGRTDPLGEAPVNCSGSSSSSGTSSASPLIPWACALTLSPYPSASFFSRRQVWCLKIVGACLIAGTSDGHVFAYNVAAALAAPPQDCCAPSEDDPSRLLWSYYLKPSNGIGIDGIRRLDIVRDLLYATTARGSVRVLRFRPPGEGEAGAPAASTPPRGDFSESTTAVQFLAGNEGGGLSSSSSISSGGVGAGDTALDVGAGGGGGDGGPLVAGLTAAFAGCLNHT